MAGADMHGRRHSENLPNSAMPAAAACCFCVRLSWESGEQNSIPLTDDRDVHCKLCELQRGEQSVAEGIIVRDPAAGSFWCVN